MHPLKLALMPALVAGALNAMAADFQLADGVSANVKATLTAGTLIRTDSPDPAEYALIPSTVVPGTTPGQLMGQTGGADLNFAKGHAVSTVVKALVDLNVHGSNLGLFVRGQAWTDLTQGHADVAYGNYPDGFKANAPLSDRGFAPDAKFDNVRLRDYYVYGHVDTDAQTRVEARVGRQVLGWGTSQFFPGGIGTALNPIDLAGQLRPGALPQEAKVPVGMVLLSLISGKTWSLDAAAPYEFRPSSVPGCGTFFDGASIVQPGCNMSGAVGAPIPGTPLSTIASLTEPALLANGYYLRRNADGLGKDSGQFGFSLRYTLASWNTELRGYAIRSNNATPNVYRVTIENVGGSTLPAGLAGGFARLSNPNGLHYSVIFPEGTKLLGLSFATQINAGGRVFGEAAYRPNQPLGMSAIDLLTASLLRAPTSLLATQRNFLATPAGGNYDAYDRFHVVTANLGANQVVPKVLGADRLVLAAELGMNHVSGLPDPAVMRYGRGLAYGAAPYLLNGTPTACAETAPGLNGVPGKTCTHEGFTSATSWGLRGRVAATYGNALLGAALTPSLLLARDVKGWSYDGTFNEGRVLARFGLRADWGTRYFGELAYTHMGGGKYNVLADRSNLSLVAGVNL